jgi:alkanesulfonate monooxygenase SsuD/methylene tetrahydromethanopterin reductase-like flavin-dependent oxidoreductase (luciferase family)
VLSAGRFELGLGAGGFPEVIAGFGGPRRTPGESVEALEEAIDVIRLLWSEERSVSFDGKHLPARWRAPRPATRAPDRDLGGSVQTADCFASSVPAGRRPAGLDEAIAHVRREVVLARLG